MDGQFCIVLPEWDAVIAITSKAADMRAELNVVWSKLLPALSAQVLEENPAEQEKLKVTIESLTAKR